MATEVVKRRFIAELLIVSSGALAPLQLAFPGTALAGLHAMPALLVLVLLLAGSAARAEECEAAFMQPARNIRSSGPGVAVVFSPDLALEGNRLFYSTLGFLYIETASWTEAVEAIGEAQTRGWAIDAVVLETHGSNGNGLKLQAGTDAAARRSYVSVAALGSLLASRRVRMIYIGACNAGRLFRPTFYEVLPSDADDPLFQPPSEPHLGCNTVACDDHGPLMLRPAHAGLEPLVHFSTCEMTPRLRDRFGGAETEFTVSTLLQRLFIGDALKMQTAGFEQRKSRSRPTEEEIAALAARFLQALEAETAPNH